MQTLRNTLEWDKYIFLHVISTIYKALNFLLKKFCLLCFSQGSPWIIWNCGGKPWTPHLPPPAPCFFYSSEVSQSWHWETQGVCTSTWALGLELVIFAQGHSNPRHCIFLFSFFFLCLLVKISRHWRSTLQPCPRNACKCKLWGPERIGCNFLTQSPRGSWEGSLQRSDRRLGEGCTHPAPHPRPPAASRVPGVAAAAIARIR